MSVKYGLLGHPLGHSFSRAFHNKRFEEMGIDAVYENFDLADISLFPSILEAEKDLCGMNVTIPYKQDVMQFLDELDPVAAEIGAVNCVKIERGGAAQNSGKIPGLHLKGYNTDIIGFTDSIRPLLDSSNKKALILGTGGVSKAVLVALNRLGIESAFVSRTPKNSASDSSSKSKSTSKSTSTSKSYFTYEDLNEEILREYTIIVNCSPVGMPPNIDKCPAIPYEFLTINHVCFDCVYIPGGETLFVEKSRARGAKAKSGYEMLVGQAIASYEIWVGKTLE